MANAKLGPEHFITLRLVGDLGCGYLLAGNIEQALAVHEQTASSAKTSLGPDHPTTLVSLNNLGCTYLEAGKLNQAEPALQEALKLQRMKLGAEHPDTLLTLANLTQCLLRQGNYTNAETVARECLQLRQKISPNHWRTFAAQSRLGRALLGQKKYAEAEPFLLQGYSGLEASECKIPAASRATLRQAAKTLVQLYEACGKPDQVSRWQRELDGANGQQADAASAPAPSNPAVK